MPRIVVRLGFAATLSFLVGGCASAAKVGSSSTGASTSSSIVLPTRGTVGVAPGTVPDGSSTTVAPSSTPAEPSNGAVALTPSSSDVTEIGMSFSQFADFTGSNCKVVPVPGTLKAATISSSGVNWAFATMMPASDCTIKDSSGNVIDPNSVAPFGGSVAQRSGVFEQQPGGAWTMNSFESQPFPCPPPAGSSPGYDQPFVPLAVLNAVGVSYASSSGCVNGNTPPPG